MIFRARKVRRKAYLVGNAHMYVQYVERRWMEKVIELSDVRDEEELQCFAECKQEINQFQA